MLDYVLLRSQEKSNQQAVLYAGIESVISDYSNEHGPVLSTEQEQNLLLIIVLYKPFLCWTSYFQSMEDLNHEYYKLVIFF